MNVHICLSGVSSSLKSQHYQYYYMTVWNLWQNEWSWVWRYPFSVPQFYELLVAMAALRPWWPLYLRHVTWYCGPRDRIHCSHHTQLVEYAVLWILFLATVWATNNHGVCVIILFIITDSSDCSFRHAVVLYQVKFSLDVGVVSVRA